MPRRPQIGRLEACKLTNLFVEFGDPELLRLADLIRASLRPGRPGRPDEFAEADDAIMPEVARRIVAGEALTATEAFRQLVAEGRARGHGAPASSIERLRRRWQQQAEARLAEARRPLNSPI